MQYRNKYLLLYLVADNSPAHYNPAQDGSTRDAGSQGEI